jgi:hypothetical protein
MCDVENWPTDEPDAMDPISLVCQETRKNGIEVLACTSDGMLPALLRDLLYEETFYIAAREGAIVRAEDGDGLMGPSWSLELL